MGIRYEEKRTEEKRTSRRLKQAGRTEHRSLLKNSRPPDKNHAILAFSRQTSWLIQPFPAPTSPLIEKTETATLRADSTSFGGKKGQLFSVNLRQFLLFRVDFAFPGR